jgi:hypothetical protein
VTRRVIERQLDALGHVVEGRWWAPYAIVVGGLAVGFLISRMPLGRVVGISARAVQTGLAVASTLAAVDRFVAERRRLARAA